MPLNRPLSLTTLMRRSQTAAMGRIVLRQTKCTPFYWMGAWTVEVYVTSPNGHQWKEEGRKDPVPSKARRGRRSHRGGTRTSRVGRSTQTGKASARSITSRTPSRTRPGGPKAEAPRALNHKLRVYLWPQVASNRLASHPVAKRLIKNFPSGYDSAEGDSKGAWERFARVVLGPEETPPAYQGGPRVNPVLRERRAKQLEVYRQAWHRVHRYATRLGVDPRPSISRNPLKFLMVRSPHVGDWGALLGRVSEAIAGPAAESSLTALRGALARADVRQALAPLAGPSTRSFCSECGFGPTHCIGRLCQRCTSQRVEVAFQSRRRGRRDASRRNG